MPQVPILRIQEAVLRWYAAYGRHDLPWRNLAERGIDIPYGVFVSEIMLQQTQVERVIPKYEAFLVRFPTIEALANASTAEVITLWSGLGYNRRAIMLQKAAQAVVRDYGGQLPFESEALRKLPGIGPYTAGAVAAFGFNQPVAVVDTNIERFFELLIFGYIKPPVRELTTTTLMWVPRGRSREWYSALMDLMTLVRRERTPRAQQRKLLNLTGIAPSWQLPELGDDPLVRPKQTIFKGSRRYFRGRVIAFLQSRPSHAATYRAVEEVCNDGRSPYPLSGIVEQLRRDGLVVYADPLHSKTRISLPH